MRTPLHGLLLLFLVLSCHSALAQDRISWLGDMRQAQQIAVQRNQLVLVHFWGENCGPCIRLEHYVFNRPEVIRSINSGFVPVKVNINERPDLADRFRITSMPVDVILTPDGRELHRSVSPQNPNQYTAQLDQVAAHYRAGTQAGVAGAVPNGPAGNPLGQAAAPQYPSGAAEVGAGGYRSSPVSSSALTRGGAEFIPQSAESPVAAGTPGMQSSPSWSAPGASSGVPQAADPYAAHAGTFARQSAQAATAPQMNAAASPTYALNSYSPPAPQAVQNQFATPDASFAAPGAGRAQGSFDATIHAPAQSNSGGFAAGSSDEQAGAAQPASFTLPPGSPPVLMEGCCPVTLVEQSNWLPGNPQFGAVHRGRTYLFASAAEQQKFLASPDRYSPVISGYDPVRFVELGQLVEGKREFGVAFNDQIFLFADAEARDRFESNPNDYSRAANEAMRQSDVASRQTTVR